MDFKEFTESKYRNQWIREPGLSIYVRRGLPRRGDYDLATINAIRPGRGCFTRFLERWEPEYQFFIENVLDERFADFFRRRGYTELPAQEEAPPCFLGPRPMKGFIDGLTDEQKESALVYRGDENHGE